MARRKDEDRYDLIWKEIKNLRLPVLTLDNKWHRLFGDKKPKSIAQLEEELNEVLKEQGRIKEQKKKLSVLKKKLMQEIINNMNAKEDSAEFAKMEKRRELIEEINDRMILLENDELDIPMKMREKNAELAMETMELFFSEISNELSEITELEIWIEKTRKELRRKTQEYEQKIKTTKNVTNYFDNLLGPQITKKYVNYLNGIDEDYDYEDYDEDDYDEDDE